MSKFIKETFEITNDEGDTVKLAVVAPNAKVTKGARIAYGRAFNDALKAKLPMDDEVEKLIEDRQLWSDQEKERATELAKAIVEAEDILENGREGMTKLQGRKVAIQLAKDRGEFRSLRNKLNFIYENTAEAVARDAQFDYFVAHCTVFDETGKPYFCESGSPGLEGSVGAYLDREAEPAARLAQVKLTEAMFDIKNQLDSLPENAWLKKYNFVDEDYNFIDKDGNKVDEDWNPVISTPEEPKAPKFEFLDDDVATDVDTEKSECDDK